METFECKNSLINLYFKGTVFGILSEPVFKKGKVVYRTWPSLNGGSLKIKMRVVTVKKETCSERCEVLSDIVLLRWVGGGTRYIRGRGIR